MNRGLTARHRAHWPAIAALIAATTVSAAVQAYLLTSSFTLMALLIVAAAVYAEARRESVASRWLRRHYGAVSGALLGVLAGSLVAPFINHGFTITPFYYLLLAMLSAIWLTIAIGILHRPGRASEEPRR